MNKNNDFKYNTLQTVQIYEDNTQLVLYYINVTDNVTEYEYQVPLYSVLFN